MDGTTTMQGTEQEVQNTATETQGQQTAESTPEKVSTLQKFIDGLFGGGKKAEGAEPEKKDGDPAAEKAEEEKSFTQADVDAAIEAAKQQWLDEAEQEKKDSEIASLRSQLLQKELRESATKSLETDGFPVGLADVLDYSSKERMEETLKNTTKVFKDSLAVAIQSRLKGKTPEGLGGAASAENLLRDQIARNVRGL